MYGPLVIAYLFLGGAAAGMLHTISVWSLTFRHSRHPKNERLTAAFHTLRKRTYAIALAMLGFSLLCLLGDLGAPSRALLLFLHPRPTVLTFGAYTLAIEATLALALTCAYALRKPHLPKKALSALEVSCSVGGIATMAYTGVFLFSGGVALWHTWALVGLFAFSALSAGMSVVSLIDWLMQGQTFFLHAAKPLQAWHLWSLSFEAFFLAAFTINAFTNPAAAASHALLTAHDMLATAVIGVVGFGILIPAALETHSLAQKNIRTAPVADIACLLGCLILRYVVIMCGAH